MTSVPLWDQLVNIPKQRELEWLIAAVLSWFLWKPIRVTINHWRLHRRQRKYPQLVVCRVDKAPSHPKRRAPAAIGRMLRNLMLAMLHSLVTFLLVLPLKSLQFVVKLWTSHKPNPHSTSVAPWSEPTSTPTQPPKRTSPPLSVLRKTGSSASIHSRVEFAEQSNGHIRTERRYYLPHAQPNQSIQPPNTQSPLSASIQSNRSEPHPIFLTPEWPSGRPNTKRQLVATQKSPISQNPTIRRDDTNILSLHHSSTPTRLLSQTPLSEQMRKRRLDEHMDQMSAKRSSLAGRVTLGGTQARIIGSRRTFVNKRDLEAREDRILKDLNSKRIKTKDAANAIDTITNGPLKSTPLPAPTDSSSVLGSTTNGRPPTPSFTFQAPYTGADTKHATSTESHDSQKGFSFSASSTFTEPGKEKDAKDLGSIGSSAGISFGNLVPSPEANTLPPSFNIPASAPSSENGTGAQTKSSTTTQGTGAPPFQFGAPTQGPSSDGPATSAATGFSFGGTSASNSSSNTIPAGPVGVPAPAPSSKEPVPGPSFSFGSASTTASGAQAPAFQFGAAAPAPAQAPGTSFPFGTASNATSEAPAPAFQFGTKDPEATPAGSGFSFGNTSSTTLGQPLVTGVSFGRAPESTIPAFNFGSTSTTIPTSSVVGGGGASARRRAKAKATRRR